MVETKMTCPMGSECETIKDGCIHRCSWYVTLQGNNPQTGDPVDEAKCAIVWQTMLAIEGNGIANSTSAAVTSLRNETVMRQDLAIKVMYEKDTEHKQLR